MLGQKVLQAFQNPNLMLRHKQWIDLTIIGSAFHLWARRAPSKVGKLYLIKQDQSEEPQKAMTDRPNGANIVIRLLLGKHVGRESSVQRCFHAT